MSDPIANLITPTPSNPAAGPTGRSAVDQSQNAELTWLDSQLDGIYNVKAYGAKGNNSTDDTAAIQAAVNAANAAGGGIVYVPMGRYILSAPITLYDNIWLRGSETSGYGGCVLVPTTLNTDCLYLYGVRDARISYFIIQLINSNYTTTTSGYGIDCVGCSYITIEGIKIDLMWGGVWFNNCSECGLNGVAAGGLIGGPVAWLDGGLSFTLDNVGGSECYKSNAIQIDDCPTVNTMNCGAVHCNHGIEDNGGQFHYNFNFQADHNENSAVVLNTPEDVKFYGGLITSSGQAADDGLPVTDSHGIFATSVNQLVITDMTIVDNKGAGINAVGSSVMQVKGCGIGGNGTSGVQLSSTCAEGEFVGNYISGNYGYGVNPLDSTSVDILFANNYMSGAAINTATPQGVVLRNNTGYNPVGVQTVSVPSSSFSVSDTFSRANGALGADWTTVTGGTAFTATPTISGDEVTTSGSGECGALYSSSLSNDQSASVTVNSLPNYASAGVILRGSNPTTATSFTGYVVNYYNNNGTPEIGWEKFTAGAQVNLGAIDYAWTAGDVLTASVIGTTFSIYVNGTFAYSFVDGTYPSGDAGIFLDGGPTLNNFTATAYETIPTKPFDCYYTIGAGGSPVTVSVSNVSGILQEVMTIPVTGMASVFVPAGCGMSLNSTDAINTFTCQGL